MIPAPVLFLPSGHTLKKKGGEGMVMNQKPSGRASSMAGGLLTGLAVSTVITVLFTALAATMVDKQWIGEKDIGYCAMVILLAAPFWGAKTAERRIQRQKLLVCVISGSLYFLLLMAVTALFFGGQYEAVGVTLLLITAGSALTLLLGSGQNRGVKHKKRKRHNR